MGDIYDVVGDAKASKGGNRIRDGRYLFEIKKLQVLDLYEGPTFIAEMFVRESEAVDVGDDVRLEAERGQVLRPNTVNSECSYVLKLQKHKDVAPGNMKAFMLALCGYSEDEVSKDQFKTIMREACGTTQPLRGAVIRASSYRKLIEKGPNKGKPFTGFRWEHVEQTDEQVAERRKVLDGAVAQAA